MEGFCVDIQRVILEKISGGIHVARLRHFFCVNRLYRRWVSRYVIDTLNKTWFLNRVSQRVAPIPETWDLISTLQQQWSKRSPTLFSSFVMYLNSSECFLKHSEKAAKSLFFAKASILKDLKRRRSQLDVMAVQKRQIEREEDFIKRYTEKLSTHIEWKDNNVKKREAAEEAIQEIDKKYKKQKE
jgi:hypothetical protein